MKIKEARLETFVLDLPYVRSEYEVLKGIGTYELLYPGMYRWTFPIDRMSEVEVALASVIQLNDEFVRDFILPRCILLTKELEMSKDTYGKSGITCAKTQDGYVLTEYRKGKKIQHFVSYALMRVLWDDVFSQLKFQHRYQSKQIWEKIVTALGKHHWDKEPLLNDYNMSLAVAAALKRGWNYKVSGHFNAKYFFGDRTCYAHLAYYPMKCAAALGLINYPKGSKFVYRLAENWHVSENIMLVGVM